jgi:hypothetical protein
MAWAEHERRAVFDGAVPWATAPRAHLLALSGLRRLSDGCRWLDACAEFDRRTAGWNPVPPGPAVPCTVRVGLPIETVTPRVLGQCAMALHLVAVPHGSLHPCPELGACFLARSSPDAVEGTLTVSTDRAVPGRPLAIGAGMPVHLAFRLEPNEPCPFLANLACLETRVHHAKGAVRTYRDDGATAETPIPLWRTRTLLTGLARFLVSARKHASRTPEAEALLGAWAAVLNTLVGPERPGGLSATALLAGDTDRLHPSQWARIAAEQERLCPCGATDALFHATLPEYARLFGGGACVSPEALLRLGWCAVAASTGLFSYATEPKPGHAVFTVQCR